MGDDRMFAQLMENSDEPSPAVEPDQPARTPDATTSRRGNDSQLPDEMESIGEAGYTSHSYRLTEAEVRWLRRFCLRLSEQMDRTVSQNELIRTLFRMADEDWRKSTDDNRLLDQLSRNKF